VTRARLIASLLAVLIGALHAPVAAQDDDLSRLFPREAEVRASAGPARLALPAEVLAASRADLADVRLFASDGAEVPYLVESGNRSTASPAEPITAMLAGASRRSSGARVSEVFELRPPPAPGVPYTLELTVASPDFVRNLRVTTLAGAAGGSETLLAEGTVFRFQAPLREQLALPLPLVPAGTRVLRVEIEGQAVGLAGDAAGYDGPFEPLFRFVPRVAVSEPPTLTVPLELRETRRVDGRTELVAVLPLGLRPDRVRIETTSPNFVRRVRIADTRGEVGSGDVFRVEALRARGGERLEVPLGAAFGDALTLTVEDGDSPPLAALRVVAVVRQPALLFFSDGEPLVLRFGGGRARAPRYDLAAFASLGVDRALREESEVQAAQVAAARPNPRFDPAPALGFLARPGTAVEVPAFTHVAELEIREAGEGVVRVRLPMAAMAVAQFGLGDVRVVDAEGRQWPYVPAEGERPFVPVRVEVGAPERNGRVTEYVLKLPVSAVFARALRLELGSRFAARPFRLGARDDEGREIELAAGTLAQAPDAPDVEFRLSEGTRAQELVLYVEDGDDAPLELRRVTLDVSVAEILVAALPGRYRLLVGAPQLETPVYELAQARALIDAVPLVAATPGRLTKNPAFRTPGFFERTGWQSLALWGALGLAVLVLGGLTMRLARQEAEAPATTPNAPTQPVGAAPETPVVVSSEPAEPVPPEDAPPA
jgi:hypothetical protein